MSKISQGTGWKFQTTGNVARVREAGRKSILARTAFSTDALSNFKLTSAPSGYLVLRLAELFWSSCLLFRFVWSNLCFILWLIKNF